MASVVDDVQVAQPVALPSSQTASTNAEEVANRSSDRTPAADAVALKPAEISAMHAAAPVHAVSPVAMPRIGVPTPAVAPPLSVAVQPGSGQKAIEPECPLPEVPGIGVFAASTSAESRPVVADASLVTAHPVAAAVQVAAV
jgi:hypothetical protein